jgi:hypothetical protein
MLTWKPGLPSVGLCLFLSVGIAWSQAIPTAPPVPVCSWDGSGMHSTCRFKEAMAGTPTSLAGHRVILFDYSKSGGYASARISLQEAAARLAARYGFTVTETQDPAIFSSPELADAKVVIMSNGEGDVIAPGANRTALEEFQQVKGWGVLWIHEACAFITSAWPFGQKSCVQLFYSHDPTGTVRRMFIDSGTADKPEQGIRNPQSEFLLRALPGWGGKRSLEMADEWNCFQAPARNTEGVNVLFGYDHGSGLPLVNNCPEANDSSEAASQNHNMVWTHKMGDGISIYNSWGGTVPSVYTGNGHMGDSLLWRFLRYAAKDWCVSGSGEPGCDEAMPVRGSHALPALLPKDEEGRITLSLPGPGRFAVSVWDMAGRRVASETAIGPAQLAVPGLRRGQYLVRVSGDGVSQVNRIMVY